MRYLWEEKEILVTGKGKIAELDNGMHVWIIPKQGYMSAYFSMTTEFGGLNNYVKNVESDKMISLPLGTAHFLEHSIFDPKEGRDLDRLYGKLGVHVNAYTTYYQQGVMGSANSENIYDAVGILKDFLSIKQFNPWAIEINKKIIYDEILRQKAKHEQIGYNLALGNAFPEFSVSDMILGTQKSLETINEDILQKVYNAHYSYDKITLLIIGDIDFYKLEEVLYINFDQEMSRREYESKIILPSISKKFDFKEVIYKMEINAKYITLVYRDVFSNRYNELEQLLVQIILDDIFMEFSLKGYVDYELVNNYIYYSKDLKYFVVQLYSYGDKINIECLIHELFESFKINQDKINMFKKKMIGELLFLEDDLALLSGELRRLLAVNSSLREKYLLIQSITIEQVLRKYEEIALNFKRYSTCVVIEK